MANKRRRPRRRLSDYKLSQEQAVHDLEELNAPIFRGTTALAKFKFKLLDIFIR